MGYFSIPTVAGGVYELSFWHKNGSTSSSFRIGTSVSGTNVYPSTITNNANWTKVTITFTAISANSALAFLVGNGTNGAYVYFDEVTCHRTDVLTPPIVQTYADGSSETLTNLSSITGLSTNGTYTVVKEKGSNPTALLSTKVTQGKTFPASPADGDYHCLTATGLQTYKRVSGAWVETQWVSMGSFTVASNVISAIVQPIYNQNGYNLNIQSFTQNLTANGWTKLPNGLILQWGTTGTLAQNATINVNLPITFPNGFLFADACYASDPGVNNGTAALAAIKSSLGQISITKGVNGSGAEDLLTTQWLAIGY
jgi:hypothetical protein